MPMVTLDACAHVVAQELSRSAGRALCAREEADDARQELMLVAWRASLRHDGRQNLAYVRTSVKNAMRTMGERARALRRAQQDQYGRPVAVLHLEQPAAHDDGPGEALGDRVAADGASPEEVAEVRQHVLRIAARLDEPDRVRLHWALRGVCEPSAGLLARVANIK